MFCVTGEPPVCNVDQYLSCLLPTLGKYCFCIMYLFFSFSFFSSFFFALCIDLLLELMKLPTSKV